MNNLDLAKKFGFIFKGFRNWITEDNIDQLAQDASLITSANTGVPAELTAYIDPMVIEILTAVRNARAIYGEVKKGDWTTSHMRFTQVEPTGNTVPYGDYSMAGMADTNAEFPVREQYIFQTHIRYGDMEQEYAAKAKINLASQRQKAAATIIDIDSNKFYLYGVAGRSIYGALNDPNLNTFLTSATTWATKDAKTIYEDVLKMFTSITENSGGQVDATTPIILAISPTSNVYLAKVNDYGLSPKKLLEAYFTSIKFVVLPELHDTTSGDTAYMVAPTILGVPTGELAYSEKMRMGRLVAEESSFDQKVTGTTYGAIIYRPFGVMGMTGI